MPRKLRPTVLLLSQLSVTHVLFLPHPNSYTPHEKVGVLSS